MPCGRQVERAPVHCHAGQLIVKGSFNLVCRDAICIWGDTKRSLRRREDFGTCWKPRNVGETQRTTSILLRRDDQRTLGLDLSLKVERKMLQPRNDAVVLYASRG